jgi:hypothetical protein
VRGCSIRARLLAMVVVVVACECVDSFPHSGVVIESGKFKIS